MAKKLKPASALGTHAYQVEQFGTRVRWVLEHLPPELRYGNRIHNLTELWRAVASAADLNAAISKKTWKRCVAPNSKYAVPNAIVRGLTTVFPDLRLDVLVEASYSDFERQVRLVSEARDRWLKAAEFHSKNRGQLAELGKSYHRAVDAEPDFPLITKSGWILKKPVLLDETSALPKFDRTVIEPKAKRLEDLNVAYVDLVRRRMKSNRQPTNRESYRLLDLRPRARSLDVTLGPTMYFQVVNTCEAIGTELADHVLRNGMTVPKLLSLRGPPEAIYDFKNRSTYPSVICVLLLKHYPASGRSRKNKFVLHNRGEDTVEAQNMRHVVPAGGHQPLSEDYGDEKELSLWHSVVREFCEELFNKEDANKMRQLGESFLELPAVRPYVDAFFRKGAAKVFLLGGGLDPVTTKMEFLFAIVVDWAKAALNAEIKFDANYEGNITLVDLSKEALLMQATSHREKPLVPSGKACLLLAAKHYDFLMD